MYKSIHEINFRNIITGFYFLCILTNSSPQKLYQSIVLPGTNNVYSTAFSLISQYSLLPNFCVSVNLTEEKYCISITHFPFFISLPISQMAIFQVNLQGKKTQINLQKHIVNQRSYPFVCNRHCLFFSELAFYFSACFIILVFMQIYYYNGS